MYDLFENNQMKQLGFKCRTINIKPNSNPSLFFDISKSISADLTKSEIGKNIAKIKKITIFSFSKSMNELDASTKKHITWVSLESDSSSDKNTSQLFSYFFCTRL